MSSDVIINNDVISHDQYYRIGLVASTINKNIDIMDTMRAIEGSKLSEFDQIPINADQYDMMKDLVKKDADYYNAVNISRLTERIEELTSILKRREMLGIPFGNRFELLQSDEFTRIDFEGTGHLNTEGINIVSPRSKVGKLTIKNLGSGLLEVGVGVVSGTVEDTSLFIVEPNDEQVIVSTEKKISYVTLKSKYVDVTVNIIAEI